MNRYLLSLAALAVALPSLQATTDHQAVNWERQIVAACLILEAADQGAEGMQAVAAVIANRGSRKPNRYLKIVQHPYAFSAMNPASTAKSGADGYSKLVQRASKDRAWPVALKIVEALYEESLADNTFGADHYSRRDALPSWSHGMKATTVIGDHLFFKGP